eukprot:TRINITY_DN23626_c0_g1_i1.p1 TRINITY_DN23626_c0_g1~~TRINITY_DN23626_c0_g1_i1.p1  ORF type:complete len:621 (+),score=128.38 TRINITY_DN23626_c0_g1_i1:66-1865(+)
MQPLWLEAELPLPAPRPTPSPGTHQTHAATEKALAAVGEEAARTDVLFAAACSAAYAALAGSGTESYATAVVWHLPGGVSPRLAVVPDPAAPGAAAEQDGGQRVALARRTSEVFVTCVSRSSPEMLLVCFRSAITSRAAVLLRFGCKAHAEEMLSALQLTAGAGALLWYVSGGLRPYDAGAAAVRAWLLAQIPAASSQPPQPATAPEPPAPRNPPGERWTRWVLLHRTPQLVRGLIDAVPAEDLPACGAALAGAAHAEGVAPLLLATAASLEMRDKLSSVEARVADAQERARTRSAEEGGGMHALHEALAQRHAVVSSLLRGASVAQAAITAYAGPALRQWCACQLRFLHAAVHRVPPGSDDGAPLEPWDIGNAVHRFMLSATVEQTVRVICDAARTGTMPPEVRAAMCGVAAAARQYALPAAPLLGGLLVLRGVCPALTLPQRHGLAPEGCEVAEPAQRRLDLLAQVLQTVANGSPWFTKRHGALQKLNDDSWAELRTQQLHRALETMAEASMLPGGAPAVPLRRLDGTQQGFGELRERVRNAGKDAPAPSAAVATLERVLGAHGAALLAAAWSEQEATSERLAETQKQLAGLRALSL